MIDTHDQFMLAVRLGRAFGHEWAVAWSEELTTPEEAAGGLDSYIDIPSADYQRLFAGGRAAAREEILEAIAAAVRAARSRHHADCRCPGGIEVPEFSGNDIVHRTGGGAGRLSWRIDPYSRVTIRVHRPATVVGSLPEGDLVVLRAELGAFDGSGTTVEIASTVLAEARHWAALTEALAALGIAPERREEFEGRRQTLPADDPDGPDWAPGSVPAGREETVAARAALWRTKAV